eukprot:11224027-Lingulodinium_polyedra.AAC.1
MRDARRSRPSAPPQRIQAAAAAAAPRTSSCCSPTSHRHNPTSCHATRPAATAPGERRAGALTECRKA